MGTKKVNFDFFTITYGQNNKDTLNEKLLVEFEKQNKTEIEMFGYLLRIGSLEVVKRNEAFASMDDNYIWVGAIERIDVKDEAYAGKKGVPGRNTYAAGSDEGPLKDTVFLYDPKTAVLILQRSRGGLNHNNMTNFVSSLCHDENVVLKVMIDKKVLSKLDRLPLIKSIEYSVSSPNPSSFKEDTRPVHGDIQLLNLIHGDRMNVVIGADKDNNLEKKNAISKVKTLLGSSKQEVKRLVVKGYNNEDLEILDLINERIDAHKKVNAGTGKKVSFIHIMETIKIVYREKYKLIQDYTK